MIGLDTNILVRYFAQDEPRQSVAARDLIDNKLTREDPGYITVIVLVEFAWVLKRLYAGKREEIVEVIEGLLAASTINIENKRLVRNALRAFAASKADFSDCLIVHINSDAGCKFTYTFDQIASKLEGFRLLRQ